MGRVFIYYLSKWSGGSGIHPTKNYKSVIRLLSEYLKNPYSYLFEYMLTDRRIVRTNWLGGSVLAIFCPPLIQSYPQI